MKVLGAVSFAQDTGSELLYPLLPTFVTGTLVAPVVALGVAEGLADAAAAAMALGVHGAATGGAVLAAGASPRPVPPAILGRE